MIIVPEIAKFCLEGSLVGRPGMISRKHAGEDFPSLELGNEGSAGKLNFALFILSLRFFFERLYGFP